MPEVKTVKPTNKVLRRTCRDISLRELRTKKIQQNIEKMLDFVYHKNNKGELRNRKRPSVVGLAANQLGLDLQIAVVDLGIAHKSFSDIHVLVDPKIIWSSKTIIEKNEGCVNLDNIRGFVKRSQRVKVEAYDRSGNKLSLDIKGWPAILLQHEVDHLNGHLFIDRLSDPKHAHLVKPNQYLEYKKKKKEWDKFVDVSKLTKLV